MKRAVKMKLFDRVEGTRLKNELVHILEEKNPLPALQLMAEHDIFNALHPSLTFTPRTSERIEAVTSVLAWWRYLFIQDKLVPWVVYFFALTDSLVDEHFDLVTRRFSLAPWLAGMLSRERAASRLVLATFSRGGDETPSKVAQALRGFGMESLLFMMAKTAREETRRAISEYISWMRHVEPVVTGDDLKAMGYSPGPLFKTILCSLRDARLDNLVRTREEERAMVRHLFPLAKAKAAP
jgi:tRNA nucleotidyltransferase (CCA-adding enzyme)